MAIRVATLQDVPTIARIHVISWQTAYKDIVASDYLSTLSIDKRSESWQDQLSQKSSTVLVSEVKSQVIGWISFGQTHGIDTPNEAEIYAIYIDPAYYRQGIGKALMEEAFKKLQEKGFKKVILWALEANQSGRYFYENMGYKLDVERQDIPIGNAIYPIIRYSKAL